MMLWLTAREWKYLSGIVELVQKLLHSRLPGVASQLDTVDPETWKSLLTRGYALRSFTTKWRGK